MTKYLLFSTIIIPSFFWIHPTFAQDDALDSLLNYYLKSDSVLLDELEAELASDSLTIFDLIDSFSLVDYQYSQLYLRLGYTSNITNAGRNFGIDQHGLSAGVSYYHKSGIFADVSGYWNSEISPHYSPTITTAGFMGSIVNPSWNYTLSYDHYFYHYAQTDENGYELSYPITNAINASSYYDFNLLNLGADYSFLFGQENAHRLRGYVNFNITVRKLGFIDRLVFLPTASVLLGNQKIYYISETYRYSFEESLKILYRKLGQRNFSYLWRNNRNILLLMADEMMQNNIILYENSDNVFGIMNYSFSVPAFIYFGNVSLTLSYHLNIPVPLPGENINLEPNSYFGCTVSYFIPFKN